MPQRFLERLLVAAVFSSLLAGPTNPLAAQPPESTAPASKPPMMEEATPQIGQTATPVTVTPKSGDGEIASRLSRILQATEVLEDVAVRVNEGVVFLEGKAQSEADREMASNIARKTEDVVGVVNRIRVQERALVDLRPAWAQLREMMRVSIQSLPLIGLAVCLFAVTWLAASVTTRLVNRVFARRTRNRLVLQVAGRAAAAPVFILGIYLILRIAGLTQMAATVVGGTGLIGLVIGIAFRDIAENFLASILLSTQRPFQIGDLISVDGQQGFVQSVSTRGTLLMTLEGNHLHIPNATIYKAVIKNFTTNSRQRLSFLFTIKAADSASEAQDVVYDVLRNHEAVLADPEPLVLVDRISISVVTLRVLFWCDIRRHSGDKVRSSVLRLTKKGLEDAAARRLAARTERSNGKSGHAAPGAEAAGVMTPAEGNFESERVVIEQQAREARLPEAGANLLAEPDQAPTEPAPAS